MIDKSFPFLQIHWPFLVQFGVPLQEPSKLVPQSLVIWSGFGIQFINLTSTLIKLSEAGPSSVSIWTGRVTKKVNNTPHLLILLLLSLISVGPNRYMPVLLKGVSFVLFSAARCYSSLTEGILRFRICIEYIYLVLVLSMTFLSLYCPLFFLSSDNAYSDLMCSSLFSCLTISSSMLFFFGSIIWYILPYGILDCFKRPPNLIVPLLSLKGLSSVNLLPPCQWFLFW